MIFNSVSASGGGGGSSSSGWEDVTSQCRMERIDTGETYPASNYVVYSNGCFLLLKNNTPEWAAECMFYPPSGYKFVCPDNVDHPLGINIGLTFSGGAFALVGAKNASDVYGLFPVIEAS